MPIDLDAIEERYEIWKKGALAGIDPEGYERWSDARSQLYHVDVPALIARVRELEAIAVAAQKAIHAERNYSLNAYEDAIETLGATVDAMTPATVTDTQEKNDE